jgi:hypothetical protein
MVIAPTTFLHYPSGCFYIKPSNRMIPIRIGRRVHPGPAAEREREMSLSQGRKSPCLLFNRLHGHVCTHNMNGEWITVRRAARSLHLLAVNQSVSRDGIEKKPSNVDYRQHLKRSRFVSIPWPVFLSFLSLLSPGCGQDARLHIKRTGLLLLAIAAPRWFFFILFCRSIQCRQMGTNSL